MDKLNLWLWGPDYNGPWIQWPTTADRIMANFGLVPLWTG